MYLARGSHISAMKAFMKAVQVHTDKTDINKSYSDLIVLAKPSVTILPISVSIYMTLILLYYFK